MLLVGVALFSPWRRRRCPCLGVVVEEQRHLRVGVDGVSELQVLANDSEGSMAAQLAAPKRLGAHRGNDTELPGGKDVMFPGGAPISSSSSAFLLPCFFLFLSIDSLPSDTGRGGLGW
jgi:hypothetical protein